MILLYMFFFFFFQAEDGIRDSSVTGVQTCALPIFPDGVPEFRVRPGADDRLPGFGDHAAGVVEQPHRGRLDRVLRCRVFVGVAPLLAVTGERLGLFARLEQHRARFEELDFAVLSDGRLVAGESGAQAGDQDRTTETTPRNDAGHWSCSHGRERKRLAIAANLGAARDEARTDVLQETATPAGRASGSITVVPVPRCLRWPT